MALGGEPRASNAAAFTNHRDVKSATRGCATHASQDLVFVGNTLLLARHRQVLIDLSWDLRGIRADRAVAGDFLSGGYDSVGRRNADRVGGAAENARAVRIASRRFRYCCGEGKNRIHFRA